MSFFPTIPGLPPLPVFPPEIPIPPLNRLATDKAFFKTAMDLSKSDQLFDDPIGNECKATNQKNDALYDMLLPMYGVSPQVKEYFDTTNRFSSFTSDFSTVSKQMLTNTSGNNITVPASFSNGIPSMVGAKVPPVNEVLSLSQGQQSLNDLLDKPGDPCAALRSTMGAMVGVGKQLLSNVSDLISTLIAGGNLLGQGLQKVIDAMNLAITEGSKLVVGSLMAVTNALTDMVHQGAVSLLQSMNRHNPCATAMAHGTETSPGFSSQATQDALSLLPAKLP